MLTLARTLLWSGLLLCHAFSIFAAAKTGRILTQYAITSANDFPVRDPRDWRLLGSTNAGQTWIVLDQRTNQIFVERFETIAFDVTPRIECDAFRLEILQVRDPKTASSVQISDIDLQGIYRGKDHSDLRPGRADLVLVQGEHTPVETRRMAFDGDLQTKWLDFNPGDSVERRSWIEWRYGLAIDDAEPLQFLSRISQLHLKARSRPWELFRLDLKALVTWKNGNYVVLSDPSGEALVDVGVDMPEVGSTVTISGNTLLEREGGMIVFRAFPIVNNDGLHGAVTLSGKVFLKQGQHPISLEWFNARGLVQLEVDYEGPGIQRQRIPNSALFRKEQAAPDQWVQGLEYRSYEGEWLRVPRFRKLTPLKTGTAENFSLADHVPGDNSGLVFSGFIDIPREGEYTFHTVSDDGSLLYIGTTQVRVEKTGTGEVTPPFRLPPGAPMPRRMDFQWVQLEGEVIFIGEGVNGWTMSLRTRSGPVQVLFGPTVDLLPGYLLHSRVRIEGIYLSGRASEEEPPSGELVVPSLDQVRMRLIGSRHWRNTPVSTLPISTLSENLSTARTVHLRGSLIRSNDVVWLRQENQMIRMAGAVRPEISDISVEAIGRLQFSDGNYTLSLSDWRELGEPHNGKTELPTLIRVDQIHSLTRDEALRNYPVRIRGVVTATFGASGSASIHDGTRGIYVEDLSTTPLDMPEAGDFLEVEGVSDPGDFAPVILTERVSKLGRGTVPEPIRPTWAQLMNGSMDMQYVEIRGAVTSLEGEHIWMLLPGGRLKVCLENLSPQKIRRYENSIIRVRGCLSATWNGATRAVVPGEIKLSSASVSVERDAVDDPFDVPSKRAGDLLLFDARADDLQRVKIGGQVLHTRNGIYYLADGPAGFRFVPKTPVQFVPGDLLEVVGFPRPEGPSLVLREAMARKVADGNVPPPRKLELSDLVKAENDSLRVTVEGRLTGVRQDRNETLLDLEIGSRNVQAIVKGAPPRPAALPLGSVLEITGVLAGRGAAEQRRVESFSLLVDSFNDLRVLERPPWWTPRHTAAAAIATLGILLVAGVWIRALRREVSRQTSTLQREVDERKQAEEIALRARREAESAREAAEAGSRAKSQFLATMSHEIRTPMNGILGMTNLLLNSGLSPEHRELAETVNSSGEALLAIMNDVLDFSKIEAGKMTLDVAEFHLRDAVEGTVDLIAERAQRKNLEINYWIEPSVPESIKGDSGRLRQILLNLLSNAVKFTERGEVFLQISAAETPGDKVHLRFTVTDTGIGLASATQHRIFAPFEQADQSTTRKYGGTGLGLAICKRLVDLMEGEIGVKSSPGQGSTFWFTASVAKVSHPSQVVAVDSLDSVRLLIVEQGNRTGSVLRDLARELGVHAEVVPTAAAASSYIQYSARAGHGTKATPLLVLIGNCDGKDSLATALQLQQHPSNIDLRIGLVTSIHHRPQIQGLERHSLSASLVSPVRKKQLRIALIQLLQHAPQNKQPTFPDSTAPAQPLKPTRILLAEDNIVNQRVALKQLQRLGYTADVAATGVEVLEAVAKAQYDVILMDCQMPELDGYQATRRIRELPSSLGRIRIIAMTANAMHGDREKCLEAGMDDYISKPVKIEDLRAALEGRRAEQSIIV